MKTKKSPKADLKNKRGLFIEVGLLLSLAICLWAFEWSIEDIRHNVFNTLSLGDKTEEMIEITRPDKPEPEPEPEPEPKKEIVFEVFEVKNDNEKVGDIDWDGSEDGKNKRNIPTIIIPEDYEVPESGSIEPVEFFKVEKKPEFPGGDIAMLNFIKNNVKYPPESKEIGIQGRVFVEFIIDINGKVIKAKVVHSADKNLDAEALRVIKLMPDWSPGKQRGKEVPVSYVIPVNFKLS